MRATCLLALALASGPPAAAAPEDPLGPLAGVVWWDDPATSEGCAEWTFTAKGSSRTLARHWPERGAGWSRDVRVEYTIAVEGGGPMLYAPSWRYTWIEAPGPDARESPPEFGTASWVAGFCLVEHDARRLLWTDVACGAVTDATPRRTWFRKKADCPERPPPSTGG